MNSGLGQFCFYLGRAISQLNTALHLNFYLPENRRHIFGEAAKYTIASDWHKMFRLSVEADVWHWFHQDSPYWPKHKKTKVVLTIHDLNFTAKYSGWKLKLKIDQLQRKVDRANRIVAISKFTRGEILRHLKVDAGKISVIYNGADFEMVEETKPAFNINKKFFFSLGIIGAKKNFHVLLPLLRHYPEHLLIMAGNSKGKYAKQIIEQARALTIADRLILPGEISEGEKQWLYRHCEAFLFPSLSEGFGLPVVEAMAYGKPVFISNLTSLPEVGGPHAYYFADFQPNNMAESLKSGLKDHGENRGKKNEMAQWVKQFLWKTAAQHYLDIYQSLLDETTPP